MGRFRLEDAFSFVLAGLGLRSEGFGAERPGLHNVRSSTVHRTRNT